MLETADASGWGKERQPFRQGGFTYFGVLVIVLIMGVILATVSEVWRTSMKREKEQELLFVGSQFRQAIRLYYERSPLQVRRFPTRLEDLLADPRYPSTQRYLRKIYVDPVSGNAKWGVVKGLNGEILGVHSLSNSEPMKKYNFSSADKSFEGKTRYSDWVFIYVPGQYPASPMQQRP